MIYELFTVGSVLFWILASITGLVLSFFVVNEKGSIATLVLGLSLVIMACFGNFNIFTYAWYNPIDFLTYVATYFSAGIIWSVFKWYFFTKARRERYESVKEKFLSNNGISGTIIPDQLKKSWAEFCKETIDDKKKGAYSYKADANSIIPRAKLHKARISRWIGYWPISLFWTVCDDFIKNICYWLSTAIMNLLQGISNRNFKGIESDFEPSNQSKSKS